MKKLLIFCAFLTVGLAQAITEDAALAQAHTIIEQSTLLSEQVKKAAHGTAVELIYGSQNDWLAKIEDKDFKDLIDNLICNLAKENIVVGEDSTEQQADVKKDKEIKTEGDRKPDQEEDEKFAKQLQEEDAEKERTRKLENEKDEAFARQLEAEEDEALAKKLQAEENKKTRHPASVRPTPSSSSSINNQITLPIALAGIPIAHLNAPELQRGDSSCGTRALLTAYALQSVLINNEPITNNLTKSFMELKKSVYDPTAISHDDIKIKNKHLDVKRVFSTDHKLASILNSNSETHYTYTGEDDLHQAITYVRSNKNSALHIIINTGGHWVLLSYVKEKDNEPKLVYIDSVNTQLGNDSTSTTCIQKLWKEYFMPYHLK